MLYEVITVNSGRLFAFYMEDTDIDAVDTVSMLISTGNKELHISFNLESFGGQTIAQIYEDSEINANGNPITISAFNRTHCGCIETKFFLSPTVAQNGDRFVYRRVLSHAQGNSGVTSSVVESAFRVFKPRTNYLLTLNAAVITSYSIHYTKLYDSNTSTRHAITGVS